MVQKMSRRGFGQIRTHRSGRWAAAYTGPDKKLHRAPKTFARKVDAEAWLTDRRREIDRELWSPPPTTQERKAQRQAGVRFAAYADKWVDTRLVKGKPLKPRTKAHYRNLLAQHINPTFGGKAVRSITRDQVDKWYAETLTDKPVLRAHSYSLLKTVLETARVRDKLLDTNPCAIAGAGQADRSIKPRPLTVRELEVVVENMPESLQAMTLLGCWGALRFGELVELRRADCDIENGVVKIRRGAVRVGSEWVVGPPKSDAGRRDVHLPQIVTAVLKAHLETHVGPKKDALLFPAKNGRHLQPSTLYRHFYKARDKAQRSDLRFHDLRHSGAVMAAQTGATLAELMARLGHSTPAAAMRYQHAAQGRDREIAEKMAKLAQPGRNAPTPEQPKV
jgi:integrase